MGALVFNDDFCQLHKVLLKNISIRFSIQLGKSCLIVEGWEHLVKQDSVETAKKGDFQVDVPYVRVPYAVRVQMDCFLYLPRCYSI